MRTRLGAPRLRPHEAPRVLRVSKDEGAVGPGDRASARPGP